MGEDIAMGDSKQEPPVNDPTKAIPLEPPVSETVKKGQSTDGVETR